MVYITTSGQAIASAVVLMLVLHFQHVQLDSRMHANDHANGAVTCFHLYRHTMMQYQPADVTQCGCSAIQPACMLLGSYCKLVERQYYHSASAPINMSLLSITCCCQVIKGIVDGCKQSGCQLLGGETAEMPGFYTKGEYDLAGFAVGAVKKDKVITGDNICAGDVVLAMKSSGVHSNGFSLVRKVLEVTGTSLHDAAPWGGQGTVGLQLLEPTIIYVKRVLKLHEQVHFRDQCCDAVLYEPAPTYKHIREM